MALATLSVRHDEPIGTISPRLYGHFAEHLGRCCYDGLWVGTDQTRSPPRRRLPRRCRRGPPGPPGPHAPLARRLLRRPLPLARRHRPGRVTPHPPRYVLRPPGRGHQQPRHSRVPQPVRDARRRTLPRRQRRQRLPAGTLRLARVLQHSRQHSARPRAHRQRFTQALQRSSLGSRKRELGLRRQHGSRRSTPTSTAVTPRCFAMSIRGPSWSSAATTMPGTRRFLRPSAATSTLSTTSRSTATGPTAAPRLTSATTTTTPS